MSANDTVLSDRALRRVEADGVVLEHNLETLRKQHDEREEDLQHAFTCSICCTIQADEPLDALVEPCGHRFHVECWQGTLQTLTRNYKSARRTAKVRKDLGFDVQMPLKRDFIRCPRCLVSVDCVTDLTGMGAPCE